MVPHELVAMPAQGCRHQTVTGCDSHWSCVLLSIRCRKGALSQQVQKQLQSQQVTKHRNSYSHANSQTATFPDRQSTYGHAMEEPQTYEQAMQAVDAPQWKLASDGFTAREQHVDLRATASWRQGCSVGVPDQALCAGQH